MNFQMNYNDFQAGDVITVTFGFASNPGKFTAKIDKVTKTMIMIKGIRFRRETGTEITSSRNPAIILNYNTVNFK